MQISGFTLVRNATQLDFPLEASLRSLLPVVDELVVNVGRSTDDTLARVRAVDDARIRIIESDWDTRRGASMLADETNRAMQACRFPWGIYIQADEVLADGGAQLLATTIRRIDADRRVEGVLVDYVHFYGGFDLVAGNRKWYRREVRAIRLDAGVHSYRDAQGFRVGGDNRRVRAVRSGAVMHHYGWARPVSALAAKRAADGEIVPGLLNDPNRPLLPWIPGISTFTGDHPAAVRDWITARRAHERLIEPFVFHRAHVRLAASLWLERLTGWRPFEYRNYKVFRSS